VTANEYKQTEQSLTVTTEAAVNVYISKTTPNLLTGIAYKKVA